MLGKIESKRRAWQKMKWLNGITDSMDIFIGEFRFQLNSIPSIFFKYKHWTETTPLTAMRNYGNKLKVCTLHIVVAIVQSPSLIFD